MVKDCGNPAANIAETLRQLYCSSAARFTRGLVFCYGERFKQLSSSKPPGGSCSEGHVESNIVGN